jgi:tetratricopeptide (TPR) repeat protein
MSRRGPLAWVLLCACASVAIAGIAAASDEAPESDPEQRKSLLAGYGLQAEVEPKLDPVERAELAKIQPLLTSDPAAAMAQLEAITTADSSALLDFTLGNLYLQQDDLDRAAESYRAALGKFPGFLRAHKMLARIHFQAGRYEEAILPLTRVIELGGGDGLTYRLLGYAYNATGQFVSAESAYRYTLMLLPSDLDAKRGLLQSLVKQQKYGEVVALCGELIAANPDRADLLAVQASAYLGLGQPQKAAEDYELMLRMGKATPQVLGALGNIYVNEGLFDLAVRAYAQALDLEPKPPAAEALRRAEALVQRGGQEQARELLARVREIYVEGLEIEDRKKILKLDARIAAADGSGSEGTTLEEVVALDPLDGEALIALGQHYARNQDPARAILYYERAEGIEGVEAEAKVRHAQLLVAERRYAEAVPLLRRAQEVRPREDVARYLEQVERLARARG